MTPAIKKWLDNPLTVVVGVSAIDIDDHHDDHDNRDDHLAAKHDDHDDHDDHGDSHSDGAFEWGGIFDLSAGSYTPGHSPKSMETMLILQ